MVTMTADAFDLLQRSIADQIGMPLAMIEDPLTRFLQEQLGIVVDYEGREEDEEEGSLYDRLVRAGVAYVTITYHGSGDEGWIEDVSFDPSHSGDEDLETLLNDHAYAILERRYPGWEINEGSEGTITIDVVNQSTNLHHGTIIETTEYEDVEV